MTALLVAGGLAQQTPPPANQTMYCKADPRLPDSDQFANYLCPMVFHCNSTVGEPPVVDEGPLGAAGDQLRYADIDCGELCVCQ